MQKAKQRLTSLVMACVMVIASMFAAIATLVMPQTTAIAADTATSNYVKVTEAPADWSGDYLIVYEAGSLAFNGGLSTLEAVKNTIAVTITDGAIEASSTTNAAKFTIAKSGSNYTIKSASGKYIGQTANGNKLLESPDTEYTNTITLENGSAKIVASGNPVLRYNATSGQERFRYFKSSTYTNQKEIQLYKYTEIQSGDEGGDEVTPETPAVPTEITETLNNANAYMSLSYSFETKETTTTTQGATDTLDCSVATYSGTSYVTWSDVNKNSGAVYAGNSAGGKDYKQIQLRSKDSSGIVTTTSGGKATKVTVAWGENTTSGRILDIYGKNTAYTQASDLYANASKGTKLGSIVCGTSTELTIVGDYAYIGLRSYDGALYLNSVAIEWAPATVTETVFQQGSEFKIRFGVEADWENLSKVDGVTEYGIRVSTPAKDIDYAVTKEMTIENGIFYVVINLGDCIANTERLTTEFTVQAYVKVTVEGENEVCTSKTKKTNSIATMVEQYCANNIATEGNGLELLSSYIGKLN